MDKTWLYHYDPETKQQSMEWRHSGSPRPPKFRVQKSAGKFPASIFWDQDDILLINYLPKGQTINAEYYSSLPGKTSREGHQEGLVLALQCLGSLGTRRTQKKMAYLDFQCLDHPPYSPDLAPSDYHLFPGLKKTIEMSPFFVRRGSHWCRGDLVGRTNFWIVFEWLAKVRATG